MRSLLLLALLPLALPAQDSAAAAAAKGQAARADFEAKLNYQRGAITLRGGLATLTVPNAFRYIDADQAAKVLRAWGNPPGEKTLGMIFPADVGPVSDSAWGVVIGFEENGYVKDDSAESIDYAKKLQEMQTRARASNDERAKGGYATVELLGWATPPHYDRATHKIYWAKELKFSDSEDHTLNYDTRVLGRRGVLVLSAVSSMAQLPRVEHDMQQVLGFVEFNDGNRYADYLPGKDKVAEYGIGALVVGAVAAKAGFFKLLIAGILALKKVLIIAAVGASAWLKKFFGNKSKTPSAASETPKS